MTQIMQVPILKGGMRRRYPGCFPSQVEDTIKKLVKDSQSVLHLFSGSSSIGNVRVDLDHKTATVNADVLEYIKTDNAHYEWVILDPDYYIKPLHRAEYAKRFTGGLAGDVKKQQAIKKFLLEHAQNVLWFDVVSPTLPEFERKGIYLYLPGGFFRVRCLTHYQRQTAFLCEKTTGEKK